MAQSWLPSSYAFSNMFADFPAGSIRNYSQTVFLDRHYSSKTLMKHTCLRPLATVPPQDSGAPLRQEGGTPQLHREACPVLITLWAEVA